MYVARGTGTAPARSLRQQATGAERDIAQVQAEAIAACNQSKIGSAGADLVSANLSEVKELLLSAELGRLCDGEHRAGDHELDKAVAEALRTPNAARVLRNAVWRQADLKGTGAKPARTIETVVRCLGGIAECKKVGPRGAQHLLYQWCCQGSGSQ